MRYLARYAATELGVQRILTRRIEKWGSIQDGPRPAELAALRQIVSEVVAELVQRGYLNDREFAQFKGNSLRQNGRSTRSARAKLLAKGVPPLLVREILPENPTADLAAAVLTARRRHLGPFRRAVTFTAQDRSRDFARLVRAGFPTTVAERVVSMEVEEAEAFLHQTLK